MFNINFVEKGNEIYLTEIKYNGYLLYLFHIFYSIIKYYKRFDNLFFLLIALCQIIMYNDYRSFVPLTAFSIIAIIQHIIENKNRIKEQLRINSMFYEISNNKIVKLKDIKIDDEIYLNLHKDIPADIIIKSGKLVVNEYNLTGEKIDIVKYNGDTVFRGTNIIDGFALGHVINIGNSCKIYNINYDIKDKFSSIENKLYNLCINNLYILLSMTFIFTIIIYYKYNIFKILHILLLFNTLIPLSLQFFLNCSSQIISKRIEKMLNIKINQHGIKSFQFNPKFIVTDKTGTLTTNKIELNNIYSNIAFNNNFEELAVNIFASSMIDLHSVTKKILKQDILEEILINYLYDNNIILIENNVRKNDGNFIFYNKINNKIIYNRHYYSNFIYLYGVKISIISKDNKYYMHIQGMPESIYKYLSDNHTIKFHNKLYDIESISNENYYLRIISHASKELLKSEVDEFINTSDNNKIKFLKNFTKWSLYVFEDYIVDGLKNTFAKLNKYDITMLTGDKYSSSLNVGKLIGLIKNDYMHITESNFNLLLNNDIVSDDKSIIISGNVLENIIKNNTELFKKIIYLANKKIIYRASPNIKQLYVTELQKCSNENVMMIGDGTNDLSAIMSSDIGIGIIGENDIIQTVSDVVIDNWNKIPILLNEFDLMKNIIINISKWVLLKHLMIAFCLCGILISNNFSKIRDPFGPYMMALFNSVLFIFGMIYTYYKVPLKKNEIIHIKNEYIFGIILGIISGIITTNIYISITLIISFLLYKLFIS